MEMGWLFWRDEHRNGFAEDGVVRDEWVRWRWGRRRWKSSNEDEFARDGVEQRCEKNGVQFELLERKKKKKKRWGVL